MTPDEDPVIQYAGGVGRGAIIECPVCGERVGARGKEAAEHGQVTMHTITVEREDRGEHDDDVIHVAVTYECPGTGAFVPLSTEGSA